METNKDRLTNQKRDRRLIKALASGIFLLTSTAAAPLLLPQMATACDTPNIEQVETQNYQSRYASMVSELRQLTNLDLNSQLPEIDSISEFIANLQELNTYHNGEYSLYVSSGTVRVESSQRCSFSGNLEQEARSLAENALESVERGIYLLQRGYMNEPNLKIPITLNKASKLIAISNYLSGQISMGSNSELITATNSFLQGIPENSWQVHSSYATTQTEFTGVPVVVFRFSNEVYDIRPLSTEDM